jgi:hypothetical protein
MAMLVVEPQPQWCAAAWLPAPAKVGHIQGSQGPSRWGTPAGAARESLWLLLLSCCYSVGLPTRRSPWKACFCMAFVPQGALASCWGQDLHDISCCGAGMTSSPSPVRWPRPPEQDDFAGASYGCSSYLAACACRVPSAGLLRLQPQRNIVRAQAVPGKQTGVGQQRRDPCSRASASAAGGTLSNVTLLVLGRR